MARCPGRLAIRPFLSEMNHVIPFLSRPALRPVAAGVALMLSLSACSSLNDTFSGDKVDYRRSSNRSSPLEVPPDLTQLATDTRFQPAPGTVVNASSYGPAASAPAGSTATGGAAATLPVGGVQVAPQAVGDVRIERLGELRWLSTPLTPEQLWPQLESFWEDRRLALVTNKPDIGILETEWSENRSKLPTTMLRKALGGILDGLYSTGELDKFRMRVERTPSGTTEIYLTHRGMEETYSSPSKDSTVWQPRARDPQLEGELLSLLMMQLGVREEKAKAEVAAPPAAPAAAARARALPGGAAAALQVDDGFDRAWRRVGLALDRSGFTVEDRDRGQGIYFVRYVDPAKAGKEEPGFFGKLFRSDAKKNEKLLARYRVSVKSEGEVSTVTVFDDSGAPENGEAGQRIVKLLVNELK